MPNSAENLLHEFGIMEPSEIDLEAIAWTQGARIRYRPLDNCDARIIGVDDKAIITINENSAPRRQRYSIAHELGHWKWHRGKILDCRVEEGSPANLQKKPYEKQADKYAANLLMPGYMFQPMSKSLQKATFKTASEVAKFFNVSLTAATIRLVEIGNFPILLVCHNKYGRKWFVRSPMVPERWFPRPEMDAESYALDILYGKKSNDTIPHRIGADAWFDCYGADRFEITEETICSNKEVLTLLSLADDEMLEEK